MKSRLLGAVCACLFTLLSTSSYAVVLPLESSLGGLAYYDPNLKITWATDASINGLDTWDNQTAWAAALTINDIGGWRLPSLNEMVTLFQEGIGVSTPGPFDIPFNPNSAQYFWSSTEVDANQVYDFDFNNGFQSITPKDADNHAWAVYDGDVGLIPMPPAIDIEKLTNGNDADGSNDSDVPRIAPGDTVTWTYQIRNDDQTAYSEVEIIVTDSDPRVTPVLDSTGDNGDLLLSPGETWIYRASAQAQDLSTVQTNLITNGDFERGDFSGWTLFTTSNGTLGGPTVHRRDVNGDGLATLAAQFRVRPITVEPDVFEGGGIFQSVTTDSGLFDISADIAKINDGAGPIVFTLLIDGTPVDTFEFGSTGIGGVDRATLNKTVQLDAGSHEVRILVERQGLGFEQWIDNITLRASVVVSGCNNGRPAYENTARVRISRSTGFSDKDSSHYCNPGATNIDIRKQAEGAETRTFPSGSDVTFGIVVENTGDEDLTSVVVTDVLVPDCDRNIGDLAAGAVAYNCTAPAVSLSFTSEVCVTGKQGGVAVNDCDPSTVEIESTGAQVVPIDIKPGNKRNVINPRSRGGIWVAVLSEDEFDPRQIKVRTVRFGPDEAKATRYYVRDVNRDGLGDLLLRFKIPQTGIACGDKEATLTGETFGGQSITGTDSIKTVGCRKKHH